MNLNLYVQMELNSQHLLISIQTCSNSQQIGTPYNGAPKFWSRGKNCVLIHNIAQKILKLWNSLTECWRCQYMPWIGAWRRAPLQSRRLQGRSDFFWGGHPSRNWWSQNTECNLQPARQCLLLSGGLCEGDDLSQAWPDPRSHHGGQTGWS